MTPSPSSIPPWQQWLALSLLPGISPPGWQRLLDRLPDPLVLVDPDREPPPGLPERTLDALAAWRAGAGDHPFVKGFRQARDQVRQAGMQLLCWGDAAYPPLLRQIHGPPPVLFIQGNADLLRHPQLAVVGSRRASREGLRNARDLAADLAAAGVTVTSGLALGIDAAAHAGALEAGGRTLAVLGTGVDRLYPAQNRVLGERIAREGALVSEMCPGAPPRASHFPRRNRIISGLSLGVLVVEAGLRSGSLITARLALEQGREVYAVPGSIRNPASRGCHRLLRQGASLVESVDDILGELNAWRDLHDPVPAVSPSAPPPDLPADQRRLLQLIEHQTCNTDELAELTGLSADSLLQALTLLEMEGLLVSVPGGYQRA